MFDAIQALKEGKITVEQARAISDIGQVIISSAKVEVDYIRATDDGKSAFIEPLPPGVTGVTRHRLGG